MNAGFPFSFNEYPKCDVRVRMTLTYLSWLADKKFKEHIRGYKIAILKKNVKWKYVKKKYAT